MRHLINSRCEMFNTCDMDNHNIAWLLNLGKTQINTGERCHLLGATKSIEKLLQVILTKKYVSTHC